MRSLTTFLAIWSLLLIPHGSANAAVTEEEAGPTGPHCHILEPGSAMYQDLFVDEKGNPIDSVEKCKQFRSTRPGMKGFFNAHRPHCTINGKDQRAISDKYACNGAGGVMNDRTHVVKGQREGIIIK